ncbi:hypothetical protein BLOT_011832 [Blomia tropicalis]|nr:hypothetical protein BLOT_011832 [Blomia tropicalis]
MVAGLVDRRRKGVGGFKARFCLQHLKKEDLKKEDLKKEDLKNRRYNLKPLDSSRPRRSTSSGLRVHGEILRKQSLAFFIFPTAAAIGSSKQSSSINRRWAICYYFLLFPTIHTQYITIQYTLQYITTQYTLNIISTFVIYV